uniref:Lysyl-lysine 2,3-aminomutase n=1 Tax=uncultured Thiotrichaceae bacterium TaxID=298394 RepID=A0A6S6SV65_9GAMM|nr:MAG: Lysyl-lysine 2,3-aminomutase [uncultured Thiotrichaceae bacterium]
MSNFPEKLTATVTAQLAETAISLQFQDKVESTVADDLPEFKYDAVADQRYRVGRGMIRKYRNRLLLIAHSHCAVHCRYCFRRHYDYAEDTFQSEDIALLRDYLGEHPEIDEVILSGGDPLMLSNQRLEVLIGALYQQASIRRIRIHSRVLTVLSQRINAKFLELCQRYRSKLVMVTHINHAVEIDAESGQVIQQLRGLGIMILNQSVLLRGVNDDAVILNQLSEKLFSIGVMPYYLNLLDRVKGAEHFYLDDEAAKGIYRELAEITSGYLLPKLVRDDGQSAYKCIVGLT